MKFVVKAVTGGRARAGMLHLGPNPFETPDLLLSTRKGLPIFISLDLLPCLPRSDSRLLQFSPLHFLDGPCPNSKNDIKYWGLHQMLGLHEYGFVAVARDSVRSLPKFDGTNKFGASFETPCGRRLVKPVGYMEMISSMRPNLWTTLADKVHAWVSDERNKTSMDRTVKWLDECITLSPVNYCFLALLTQNMWQNLSVGLGRFIKDIRLSRKDKTPIVQGCSCYTCQNHTKAYINHLLNVHEMLAQILLEIHNTYHYLGFFRSIKYAIKANSKNFRTYLFRAGDHLAF
ncbi:hypothetical protein LWI29_010809 [Acer saccharum]|uniref:tRNA-guanine(15) transglycosylase-like domain-containing protein n=1 Tax=Acer saccharum TaxID=4024 RepID=A0AA39VDK7_ACESA|nr:hypothetical protein LWI29_010809 [Acer saccharum]